MVKDPFDIARQPLLLNLSAAVVPVLVACAAVAIGGQVPVARMPPAAAAVAAALFLFQFVPARLGPLLAPVTFLVCGPLAFGTVAYVLSGSFGATPLVASLPLGFLAAAAAYLRVAAARLPAADDAQTELRLSPILLVLLFAMGYASVLAGVGTKLLPLGALAAAVTIPAVFPVLRAAQRPGRAGDLRKLPAQALSAHYLAGLLIFAGFAARHYLGKG